MVPRCDDGTLSADSAIVSWSRLLFESTQQAYRPIAYNQNTRQDLHERGFVDIQEKVIRIPLNPWCSDPDEKERARWYNLGLTQGIQALSLAPFYRVKAWRAEDVNRLVSDVKREICSKKIHVYHNL